MTLCFVVGKVVCRKRGSEIVVGKVVCRKRGSEKA
jgi:hypothetical protein